MKKHGAYSPDGLQWFKQKIKSTRDSFIHGKDASLYFPVRRPAKLYRGCFGYQQRQTHCDSTIHYDQKTPKQSHDTYGSPKFVLADESSPKFIVMNAQDRKRGVMRGVFGVNERQSFELSSSDSMGEFNERCARQHHEEVARRQEEVARRIKEEKRIKEEERMARWNFAYYGDREEYPPVLDGTDEKREALKEYKKRYPDYYRTGH